MKPHQNKKFSTYSVLGVTLTSDFPFAGPLTPISAGPVDLMFTCNGRAPIQIDYKKITPLQEVQTQAGDGESRGFLYHVEGCNILRFKGVADFYLKPQEILCHVLDPQRMRLIESYFLGTVISFWLECRGIPTLHSSAVTKGNHTLAILGRAGAGKSTLTAAMVRGGCSLLSEGILAVEKREETFFGRPGIPELRLWPDAAEYFLGNYEDLEKVSPEFEKRRISVEKKGFGTFYGVSRPMTHIYLPERREETKIEILPISPRNATIELIRHSFSPAVVEAAGFGPRRLGFLSQMASRIPVRRVIYPNGLEHLPLVCEAIIKDVESSL